MKKKAVPVCETGVMVHMTQELYNALLEAGHDVPGRPTLGDPYYLRGGRATILPAGRGHHRTRLYPPVLWEKDAVAALTARKTLPTPMSFLGYKISRRGEWVRVGCSRFRLSDVLALARDSNHAVKAPMPRRRDRIHFLDTPDGFLKTLTITVDGDVRFHGMPYPRECLLAVTKKLTGKR